MHPIRSLTLAMLLTLLVSAAMTPVATQPNTLAVQPPAFANARRPVLARIQAIQIALEFCQAIGQPVSATPTVVYPAPPQFPDEQDGFWQPRWRVIFPD